MRVSALGFGCGDVGGLMVRGTPAERERGVARALEHGINYLDTAPAYGSGESEKNLGQVLRALKPAAIVGTKWRLAAADLADVGGAVARSVETSLGRLGLERVDLLHLHNLIGRVGDERPLGVARVLEAVVPAVRRLQEQGKVRFFGVTASGETGALHRALSSGVIDTAQVVFNLLNPTGAYALPVGYPAQDYDRLLVLAREQGVGTIGIRVLAGGALSGQVALRHRRGPRPRARAAGGPGPRGQPRRGRAALRDHRRRHVHRADRLLRPRPARLRRDRGQQGPSLPRRPPNPHHHLGVRPRQDLTPGARGSNLRSSAGFAGATILGEARRGPLS